MVRVLFFVAIRNRCKKRIPGNEVAEELAKKGDSKNLSIGLLRNAEGEILRTIETGWWISYRLGNSSNVETIKEAR